MGYYSRSFGMWPTNRPLTVSTLTVTGNATVGGQLNLADGSQSAPSLNFADQAQKVGAYAASNELVLVGADYARMYISSSIQINAAFQPYADNTRSMGAPTKRWTIGYFSQSVALDETTAPSGVADRAQIFAQDNGSGKTQLMVQFPTGAAQQLGIEP